MGLLPNEIHEARNMLSRQLSQFSGSQTIRSRQNISMPFKPTNRHNHQRIEAKVNLQRHIVRMFSDDASGTSAVAIDNKIEQAMDLVKSHLMIAVREEVEVLKEKIAELMDRINQLELENTILKANVSQETLTQLSATIQTAATTANPTTAVTQPPPTVQQQQQQQQQQQKPPQNTNTSNGPVS